jgi:hypothetical protein
MHQRPEPHFEMNTRKPGEHQRQAAMAAMRRLTGNRHYAVDADAQLALGAMAEAWREQKKLGQLLPMDCEPLMERLAQFDFLELTQQRAVEPEKVEWPRDAITQELLPNPWLSNGNLGARNLVNKFSPALARHMERVAKGEQWQVYAEGLAASAERAELNAIRYDEGDHKANVFRTSDLEAQGAFVKANSPDFPKEGLKVEFFRREAKDIRPPWSHATLNRYRLGLMLKADEELGNLAMRATQIEQRWLEEQRQIVRAEEEAAKAKLAAIQARMGHGPSPTEQDQRAQLAHDAAQRR